MAYVRKWDDKQAVELPAAEAVAIGDVVYITSAAKWAKADANATGLGQGCYVIVTPQSTVGGMATGTKWADIDGLAPDGSTPAAGDWVYLSTTAGGITKTLSTVIANGVQCVKVGVLLSATRCLFDFGPPPTLGQTAGNSNVGVAVV